VVSDVLKLNLEKQFDIVFMSYGTLCWLPDIKQWGEVVAKHLKPGGRFVIVEFHPFLYVTNDELTGFDKTRPYTIKGQAIAITNVGSYSAATSDVYITHEFNHSLADIFAASSILGICQNMEAVEPSDPEDPIL